MFRNNNGGRLVVCRGCGRDAMNLPEAQIIRNSLSVRMTGCTCPNSCLHANTRGIELLTSGTTWAGQDVLRALAVMEGCDLAIIDKSEPPTDKVRVYRGTASGECTFCSWASKLQPRILRQQAGRNSGSPERPLRVLLYNGRNHYDATRPIESHGPHANAAHTTRAAQIDARPPQKKRQRRR